MPPAHPLFSLRKRSLYHCFVTMEMVSVIDKWDRSIAAQGTMTPAKIGYPSQSLTICKLASSLVNKGGESLFTQHKHGDASQ